MEKQRPLLTWGYHLTRLDVERISLGEFAQVGFDADVDQLRQTLSD